ncbi:MAG: C-terminal binding protein [Deltaproteobacteria bacterium]|nr:C-terminal binding protein [Deltaproteobacteria bacterium]
MARYKIVNVQPYWEDCSIERKIADQIDASCVFIMDIDYEAIYREIPDCDALVIQYLKIDEDLLKRMPGCKVIVRSAVGINNIDLKACADHGIYVANVPDYLQGEVSDHVMAMFLAINRKLRFLDGRVRSGHWSVNDARPLYLLKTQSMGILGCGQIGRQTASRARAFGMKVYGYDPFLPEEVFLAENIIRVKDPDELFSRSDHISVHMPLTPETTHMVNYDRLCRLKKHSIVLNSSRGPVVSNDDLYRALKEGRIFGAGLDVLEEEPPTLPLRLAEFDTVLFTPHVGYYSQEAEMNMKRKSFEEVVRFFTEGRLKHCVNQQFFPQGA